MTTIPLVDLGRQYESIREDIDAAVARVIKSAVFIQGPEVGAFEREFAAFVGARHAVGVGSGTDALHLALRACGVRPGDEVVTTAMSFFATPEAIRMCGATPVFVDIDPATCNLDVAAVEAQCTSRTRAIVPVHLYGQPADMDPLLDIARHLKIAVVEDAAQAHGARYCGRPVGTIGRAACFSFYPGKNLGAYGDAGAVVTDDDAVADQVRLLRDHGRRSKYEHLVQGFGARLDALQAAVLRAKLPHLEGWNARRRALAARYTQELTRAGIDAPHVPEWAVPVWHLLVVRVKNRAAVQKRLADAGVSTGVHYPIPLHLQPALAHLGLGAGSYPEAERAAGEVLSLPMFAELDEREIPRIVSLLGGERADQPGN